MECLCPERTKGHDDDVQGNTDVHTDGHSDVQTSSCIFESASMWPGSASRMGRCTFPVGFLQGRGIAKISTIDNQLLTKQIALLKLQELF